MDNFLYRCKSHITYTYLVGSLTFLNIAYLLSFLMMEVQVSLIYFLIVGILNPTTKIFLSPNKFPSKDLLLALPLFPS